MMQGQFVEECQYGVASGVDRAAQVDELIGDLHGVSINGDWLRWRTITNVL